MNQNVSSGFLIKPWPVLLDHYSNADPVTGGKQNPLRKESAPES